MRTCIKCGEEKEDNCFTIRRGTCKECTKLYNKKYRQENKDYLAEWFKNNYINNRKEILDYHKEYYKNNKNDIMKYQRKYEKNKLLTDPAFKLRKNCSVLIRSALQGNKRGVSILNYLPYSIQELKQHLERQFDNKMSWDNYGQYWHIDHIIPQSKLLYINMEEDNFQKCWALTNLRPLEAIENIKKSNKVINVPK